MTLVLNSPIPEDIAAYAPCIVSGTSTRSPILESGELQEANITAYSAGYAGKLSITTTVDAGSPLAIGDIITISGAIGDMSVYNGRHKVVSYTSSSITVNTIWDSEGVSNSSGKFTRTNDGMKIRIEVYNNTNLVGTIYGQPIKNTWEIDLSGILKSQFTSIFTLSPGINSTSGMAFPYLIKYYEDWLDIDFSILSEESNYLESTGIAHRTVSLTNLIEGKALPTKPHQSKYKIFHHFLTDKTSPVKVEFIPHINLTPGTSTIVTVTAVNKHAFVVYDIPSNATTVKVKTTWNDDTEDLELKDVLLVRVPGKEAIDRVYFLNSLGGIQTIECNSREDTEKTEKVNNHCIKAWVERNLVSLTEIKESAEYFKDFASSSEVYDSLGNKVSLITPAVRFYGNNVSVLITLKYPQNIIN